MQKQEQKKHKDNTQTQNDEEIKIIIDETGSITENLSKSGFGYLLLGIFGVTVAILLGIVAVINILDATDKIPKILTNQYGVVINSEPEKQVCYFLLNSSQLWAETGIQVEEGDLVSVYASGSINTGIHHVVKAANENRTPEFGWSGPGGLNTRVLFQEKPADHISLKYLVQPSANQGELLMMVANGNGYNEYTDTTKSHTYFKNDIITIGEGKAKVRINKNGLLHFCVNEVYLSKKNIIDLRKDYIDYIHTHTDGKKILKPGSTLDSIRELNYDGYARYSTKSLANDSVTLTKLDSIEQQSAKYLRDTLKNKLTTDEQKYLRVYNRIFELEQYYVLGYELPWYDDNLGSYLVVVEIEKAK